MQNVVDLTPRKRTALMIPLLDGKMHRATIQPFDGLVERGVGETDPSFYRRCLLAGAVELDGKPLDVGTLSDNDVMALFWSLVLSLNAWITNDQNSTLSP